MDFDALNDARLKDSSFVITFEDGTKYILSWDAHMVDSYDGGTLGGTMWLEPLD